MSFKCLGCMLNWIGAFGSDFKFKQNLDNFHNP